MFRSFPIGRRPRAELPIGRSGVVERTLSTERDHRATFLLLPLAFFEVLPNWRFVNTVICGPLRTHLDERAQSFDDRTSRASRRPSPRKLSEKRVRENTTPGNMSNQGYYSIFSAPSLMSTPHELRGGCTPSPRKLKNASNNITAGIVRVV